MLLWGKILKEIIFMNAPHKSKTLWITDNAHEETFSTFFQNLQFMKPTLIIDSMKSFSLLSSQLLHCSMLCYAIIQSPNPNRIILQKVTTREKWSMPDWFLMIDLLSLGQRFRRWMEFEIKSFLAREVLLERKHWNSMPSNGT